MSMFVKVFRTYSVQYSDDLRGGDGRINHT